MKNACIVLAMSLLSLIPVLARTAEHELNRPEPPIQPDLPIPSEHAIPAEQVRFAPLHVHLDTGAKSLAVYQFELKAPSGRVKIVGVEGGAHTAFREPPYYDPAALMNHRIIIGAFNTGRDLPHGKTRVATLHLQITGEFEPDYEVNLTVTADRDGATIPATVTLEKGEIL